MCALATRYSSALAASGKWSLSEHPDSVGLRCGGGGGGGGGKLGEA